MFIFSSIAYFLAGSHFIAPLHLHSFGKLAVQPCSV